MTEFLALKVSNEDANYQAKLVRLKPGDLDDGDVTIAAQYSSVNYKDALAVTGKGKILRKLPCIPGIDVAGKVIESRDSRYIKGDPVLVTGCNLGETHDGGYAQVAKLPADWIVPLPKGLSTKDAMIFGTAGFTAALCIHRLEQNGQTPAKGPILVTGASGGVGSFAVSMLARGGYEVHALSAKIEQHKVLKGHGAKKCLTPDELNLGSRPLESARWAGAIDNVGGDLLAKLVGHIDLWGNIACVGLAGGHELNSTVMPMILRGVSLLGISSNNTPMNTRRNLWSRMASDLKPKDLDDLVSKTIGLSEIIEVSNDMLARKTHGRILVVLNS